jgi:hypothetical protein
MDDNPWDKIATKRDIGYIESRLDDQKRSLKDCIDCIVALNQKVDRIEQKLHFLVDIVIVGISLLVAEAARAFILSFGYPTAGAIAWGVIFVVGIGLLRYVWSEWT